MSPKSLLYYSQLKINYLLYNIIELVERNGFWYCFCNETSGCESKNKQKKVVSTLYVAIKLKI